MQSSITCPHRLISLFASESGLHDSHLPVEIVLKMSGRLGLCRALYRLLVEDEYGRDLHYALRGVSKNVEEKKFRAMDGLPVKGSVGRWEISCGGETW